MVFCLGKYTLAALSDLPDQILTALRIHQDIHPANIFVFPEPSGDSYDVRFKLGDFGATHVNRLRGRDGDIQKKRYNDGNMNRMYRE